MFTGLIQARGRLTSITREGSGQRLTVDLRELPERPGIGASIAVSGMCLTVRQINGTEATFQAAEETVRRTFLHSVRPPIEVNLEPALRIGDPLDGHIVTGHVDCVGEVLRVEQISESWVMRFSLPSEIRHLVAGKGSVAVDGISLTVVAVGEDWFTVSVIPHTYEVTTLGSRSIRDAVNLEADILARYIARAASASSDGLNESFLRQHGFA